MENTQVNLALPKEDKVKLGDLVAGNYYFEFGELYLVSYRLSNYGVSAVRSTRKEDTVHVVNVVTGDAYNIPISKMVHHVKDITIYVNK